MRTVPIHAENEVSTSRLSKVRTWTGQTDTQTNATKHIITPHSLQSSTLLARDRRRRCTRQCRIAEIWKKVTFITRTCTLRSGLCYRKSVCRLSVTFVHPTQGVEAFGNISSPLSHRLTSPYNFMEIIPGEPSIGGVKRKRGSKLQRFWTC